MTILDGGVEEDGQAQPGTRSRDHRLSPGRPPARPHTQRERGLTALRRAGAHGIAADDFLLPNVVDGGAPIVRLPARLDELRAAGHHIEHAGRRNRCAVYVLVSAPAPTVPAADGSGGADQAALFGAAVGLRAPRSPYDLREAA